MTLFVDGVLHGCIGSLSAQRPLFQAVADHACAAGFADLRFPALTTAELSRLIIEISLLSEPRPLGARSPEEILALLRPGEHGVLLRIESRIATFLPQVWRQFPDKAVFMEMLAQKAGFEARDWRLPGAEVSVYAAESFFDKPLGEVRMPI